MCHQSGVRYQINDRDEIIFVDAAWDQFAKANDGAAVVSHEVIGHVIWDFISDEITRQLYRHIVTRARQGHISRFQLRCDSPSCKRSLEMTIHATETNCIEFTTQILQVETRAPIALMDSDTPRSTEWLRVCSWCHRINVDADTWVEVDAAAQRLKLFEVELMPQLTHSICDACFKTMTDTFEDLKIDP